MNFLEDYLKSIPFKDTRASIRKVADKILNVDLRKSHKKKRFNELLLGEVQSGKTSHIFGVMTSAIDAGFYHFLLVTSDNTKLQNQTFLRALQSFQGNICVCSETDTLRFRMNTTQPSLVVLKKNSRILKKWRNEFLNSTRLKDSPLFVIDDEADACSLNTKINQENYSTINANLRAICDDAQFCVYLQVTATPQAILLQPIDSDFRPDSVTYFEPGKDYLGGNFFFAKPDSYCIRELESSEIEDNKDESSEMSEGLASAIRHFLLVSAETRLSGKTTCSALIHPSVRIKEHNLIAQKIGSHLNDILQNIEDEILIASFKETWKDIQKTKPDFIGFTKLMTEVRDMLFHSKFNIITLNSVSDSSQSITEGFNIVIGGNTLGRGVTFPHLQTIYYSRTAKVPQADTFWQHCRMFGYDRDRNSIRLFMPPFIHKLFQELNASQNTLIRQITTSGIDDTHLFYMDVIRPTRKNVVSSQDLQLLVGGVNYFAAYPVNTDLRKIDDLLSNFPESDCLHEVDIKFLKNILSYVDSDNKFDWLSKNFVSALEVLEKTDDDVSKKVMLLVKRNRSITAGTGTMLSASDRQTMQKYPHNIVCALYRLTGEIQNGWHGTPLWMPSITLPEGYTFYKM